MDFHFYPFGNAKETKAASGYTFECQHGAEECTANMYQACAISHFNSSGTSSWWPFVGCMEASRAPADSAKDCASKTNVDWDVIVKCAGTDSTVGSADDGNVLMHEIAQKTINLVPPHQYTPWTTLNGKPQTTAQGKKTLIQNVCDLYKGTKPSGCSKKEYARNYPQEGF